MHLFSIYDYQLNMQQIEQSKKISDRIFYITFLILADLHQLINIVNFKLIIHFVLIFVKTMRKSYQFKRYIKSLEVAADLIKEDIAINNDQQTEISQKYFIVLVLINIIFFSCLFGLIIKSKQQLISENLMIREHIEMRQGNMLKKIEEQNQIIKNLIEYPIIRSIDDAQQKLRKFIQNQIKKKISTIKNPQITELQIYSKQLKFLEQTYISNLKTYQTLIETNISNTLSVLKQTIYNYENISLHFVHLNQMVKNYLRSFNTVKSNISDNLQQLELNYISQIKTIMELEKDIVTNKKILLSEIGKLENIYELQFKNRTQIDKLLEFMGDQQEKMEVKKIEQKITKLKNQEIQQKINESNQKFSVIIHSNFTKDQISTFKQLVKSMFNNIKASIIQIGQQIEDLIQKSKIKAIKKMFKRQINQMDILYIASQSNFSIADFHAKCDHIENTLTILKLEQSNRIIGGFTPLFWDKAKSGYEKDSSLETFLFSLNNNLKVSLKVAEKAIYQSNISGPVFGNGHDLCIGTDGRSGWSRLGFAFYNSKQQQSHPSSLRRDFTGLQKTTDFHIKEWIVILIKFK